MFSSEKQTKSLQAIKREGSTSQMKINNARACSNRFISGKPTKLIDKFNPDWVPSINMGYKDNPSPQSLKWRDMRGKLKQVTSVELAENIIQTEETSVEDVLTKNTKDSQTDLTLEKLTDTFLSLTFTEDLRQKLKKLSFISVSLENNYVKTRYYTGLATYNDFKIVLRYIEPFNKMHQNTILSPSVANFI